MDEFIDEIIQLMITRGDINEEMLRNFRIRQRFHVLHDHEKIKVDDCKYILSDEFNLSPETIHHVIYKAKK